MSPKLNQKDRKLFLGAGFVFILLVVTAFVLSSSDGGQAEYPSSYSSASGGAKAAYLLLSETGYKIQRWERPLSDLPLGPTKTFTVVLAEPEEAPTREERERLKTFISQGGHVIATGVFAGTLLPKNESVPDILSGMTWKKATSLSPSQITRAAPQIVLAPRAYWQASTAAYSALRRWRPHGSREISLRTRRGSVVGCGHASHQCGIERAWQPGILSGMSGRSKTRNSLGRIHSRLSTNAGWFHCPLAGEVAFRPISTSGGGNRCDVLAPQWPDLCAEDRGTPITDRICADTRGLYERAGTASVAVDICYRRFRYWLTRRLGVAG